MSLKDIYEIVCRYLYLNVIIFKLTVLTTIRRVYTLHLQHIIPFNYFYRCERYPGFGRICTNLKSSKEEENSTAYIEHTLSGVWHYTHTKIGHKTVFRKCFLMLFTLRTSNYCNEIIHAIMMLGLTRSKL